MHKKFSDDPLKLNYLFISEELHQFLCFMFCQLSIKFEVFFTWKNLRHSPEVLQFLPHPVFREYPEVLLVQVDHVLLELLVHQFDRVHQPYRWARLLREPQVRQAHRDLQSGREVLVVREDPFSGENRNILPVFEFQI